MADDFDETVGFSWSDSFRAVFAPCIACLSSGRPHLPAESSTPHLDALLADARSSRSTLADGETLSLHSSIGDAARQRRRKSRFGLGDGKSIRLWGWDLFGKPRGAIQLPDDDEAEEREADRRRRRKSRPSHAHSSSTLSSEAISDAAPLDANTIASRLASQKAQAAEDERAKAERRARRRERKAAKAAALSLAQAGEGEFEGFQGSGPGYPGYSSPYSSAYGSESIPSPTTYVPDQPYPHPEEEELGDFDAQAYTHTRPRPSTSRSRSGSQSVSSGARSATHQPDVPFTHHYHAQQPAPVPAPATARPKRSKKAKSSTSSRSSHSEPTTHDSSSLASPPPFAATFPPPALAVHTEEDAAFEGFPDDLHLGGAPAFPSPGLGAGGGGFPSTGFGGPRAKRDVGAFLARRGDDM